MEDVINAAKDLIREKNNLYTRLTGNLIGYSRNVDERPFRRKELRELQDQGYGHPFTGDIRVSFAEFLLDEEIQEAVAAVKKKLDDDFYRIPPHRQQFFIHMAHDLGVKNFLNFNKKFFRHVSVFDWELATAELLSYDSPMGRNALI